MRRPNGTGTITKMSGSRRKPYAVRVPTRDKHGRVVQKYLSYHATQKEALEPLDAYRYQFSIQQAPKPDDLGQTLTDAWEGWKRKVRFDSKMSDNTRKTYQTTWNALSELHNLKLREIGIDQWQSIIDHMEMTGKDRIVPVHPAIKPYIDAWYAASGERLYTKSSGKPMGYAAYREHVVRIMVSIGCPDATAHWCRHTMATRLKQAGIDTTIIKLILGHSTGDITERYTHFSADQLKEAILMLP